MPLKLNIIGRSNGVGLDQDAKLIKATLEAAGMQVTVSHSRGISWLQSLLPKRPQYDANIFLERTFPRWFGTAKHNLLIPNQERYPHRLTPKLKHMHAVLCKTHHAEHIFNQFAPSHYIGFSSPDRSLPDRAMDYQRFFHLAGKSTLKGTQTLLELWQKHPEWPSLTLVQHASNAPTSVPDNVDLITDYLSNAELQKLQNSHGIHLCPSLSEGWGHYIVEAMSCKALVVTTDAPPMNELISPDRGTLVPISKSEPRHLGTNFYVDPHQLEQKLTQLMQLPEETKKQMGAKAHTWFEENNATFRTHLPEVIVNILNSQ
ncbi:glycosyltransferase [Rubritalea tangerina]|uniref:Glycosyltransferase n=1 Tax=Rubritalea tangerina TaxID=430798 RepID=A0ABW4ZD09_9BACT